MLRALLLSMALLPTFAMAGNLFTCEQKQQMCKAGCELANIGDEKGLSTCNAKCLGERVSCSLEAGSARLKESAEKLKADSQSEGATLKEQAEAFWQGMKGNSDKSTTTAE